jgi:hypothetical protein
MSLNSGPPTLKNTFFSPNAKRRYAIINQFFSNAVLASKMPYFVWEGKVYRVNIPACGCIGKATFSPTGVQYSDLTK